MSEALVNFKKLPDGSLEMTPIDGKEDELADVYAANAMKRGTYYAFLEVIEYDLANGWDALRDGDVALLSAEDHFAISDELSRDDHGDLDNNGGRFWEWLNVFTDPVGAMLRDGRAVFSQNEVLPSEDPAPVWWGVMKYDMETGVRLGWYTNEKHPEGDAQALAKHYQRYSPRDLNGRLVRYQAKPIGPNEKY